jgi:hypothetical protein
MLRIIDKTEGQETIRMVDMPYNAIAKVVDDRSDFNGHYIVRIHDSCYLNLNNGINWEHGNTLVKLLPPDEKVTVEFFNEE